MPRQTTDLIFVHCSATKPSMDTDIKDIDRWHRERGFLKVGYHFVIKRDGTLQKGRELMEAGAHVKSYNHRSIGLCLIGGVSETNIEVWENNFQPVQFSTLYNLLVDLKEKFPDAKIMGHNEVSPKACPSFNVQEWLVEKELIKVSKITTEDEKLELEEARTKYRKEELERFDKFRKE
jgi:N-acetyl-anhydromuramyl-L-alanine amidase AmpD